MKDFVGFAKWLLEKDIRAKNGVSFLVALISVIITYFASRHRDWFQEIREYGAMGVVVALSFVFLISFLCVSLVWLGVANHYQRIAVQDKLEAEDERRKKHIRDQIETLSDWQRSFLLRFIVENRSQISEFHVGGYRAAWDFEMEVLVSKGIVKFHLRAGVYEIEPTYRDYLIENWDRESSALS